MKDLLKEGPFYVPNVFMWFPYVRGTLSMFERPSSGQVPGLFVYAIRAHYYTSAVGDDQRLTELEEQMWQVGFTPRVYKKFAGNERTKGVDIGLATEFLSNAFQDNYGTAVLVAGDADYVPMVREVKRLGKRVYVAFFERSGLNPKLRRECDYFFELEDSFRRRWANYQPGLPLP